MDLMGPAAAGGYGNDLYRAARRGETDDIEHILEETEVTVDRRDTSGWTALHHASLAGQADCMAALLRWGADVNAATTREGHTSLHLACLEGHLPCLSLLNDWEAFLLELNKNEECQADEGGSNARVDVNAKDYEKGSTALHLALERGNLQCGRFLLTREPLCRRVRINEVDHYGRTPLHLLVEKRQDPAFVVWLLSRGARVLSEVVLPASWDTTPWEKACSQPPVPRPESFQPLLRKEEDDVCFQVEGSEHLIFCNKQLLCEECEYFRAMFGSSMREAQSSFIPSSACDDEDSGLVQNKFQGSAVFVKDITEGSFLGVLEWLYTKSLSTTDFELLLQIWQDSEMYYLEELKQYCQRRLLQYFRESKDMQQHHDKDPSHLFQYLLAVFESMDPETTKEDATEEDDDGDSIIFDNCATAHERWDELNSVMRAIIASCILQRLDKVLLYYDGDLIDLVGRLFSVLAMQPYDPHVYPPADEHWLKDIEVWRQRQPTEQDINGSLHKPSLTDEQHSTNAKQRQDEDEGMKMLCFDGGGMRALRQIAIMRELERKTREEGQEGASGICSNFDVICGTGFGGLIALSIGIGKTWDEMTALIWAIFHRVFAKPLGYLRWTLTGTHYDAAALEHIFEEYFGAATMHDLLQPERNCNIMAIAQRMDVHRPILLWPGATPSLQQQQEVALGGTKGEEAEEEDMVLPCTLLRGVAMALVASPGHFPSKPLEMKNGSRILVGDASSLHHNPSYVALTAARRLRPHRRVSLLLSVGCGRMDPSFSPGQSFLSSLLVPPTFLWNRKTKVTPATFDEQSRGATLLASLLLMEGRQQRWERLRQGSSPPHCFRFFTHLSAHNFSQEHSEDEEWHLLPRGLNGNRNKKQLSAYFEDVSLKEKCERGIQEDDQEDELLEGFVVLNATATSIENGKEECSESCFKEGIEEEALCERMLDRIDVLVAKDAKEDGRGYQACAKYFRLNPRDDRIRWNESNAELLRDSVASCSRWIKRINPSLVFHP